MALNSVGFALDGTCVLMVIAGKSIDAICLVGVVGVVCSKMVVGARLFVTSSGDRCSCK